MLKLRYPLTSTAHKNVDTTDFLVIAQFGNRLSSSKNSVNWRNLELWNWDCDRYATNEVSFSIIIISIIRWALTKVDNYFCSRTLAAAAGTPMPPHFRTLISHSGGGGGRHTCRYRLKSAAASSFFAFTNWTVLSARLILLLLHFFTKPQPKAMVRA